MSEENIIVANQIMKVEQPPQALEQPEIAEAIGKPEDPEVIRARAAAIEEESEHVTEQEERAASAQAAALLMYYHMVGCGLDEKRKKEKERWDEDSEEDKEEGNK